MKRLDLPNKFYTEHASRSFQPLAENRLTYWFAALGLFLTVDLADAAVLTVSAGLVTRDQLIASGLAYLLIGFGILTTAFAARKLNAMQIARVRVARSRNTEDAR